MSTIPQWFVTQWDTAVRTESSQKDSRLSMTVNDRGSITGESFTINRLADDGRLLSANTVRHGDTEWSLESQSAAVCNMSDFYEAVPLDRNDIPKMLVNPVTGGDYMGQLMSRRNRRIDDIIYNAARGSQLMKDGTSIVLPAGQKIAVGGTAFTKAKIIAARKLFRKNDCDEHNGEELYMLYNDEMLDDVLSDATLTTIDQMAVKAFQEGDINRKWAGFQWIPYQNITKVSTDFFTIAYAKSGIHIGKGYEEGNVARRGDKKDAWQVSMGASYGAGRQDEKKVVEISFL